VLFLLLVWPMGHGLGAFQQIQGLLNAGPMNSSSLFHKEKPLREASATAHEP
jgi:hypothetical protein